MTLQPGTRLGPYEIGAAIGAGGMGEVYRARDTRLLRDVAIKVVPASLADQPDALARFEREAQTVAALSHPNIVVIFDVGREAGVSFLVMELLEGETLRARLNRGPMPESVVLDLAYKVAVALAAAHARNVVHRDLKPENLFLSHDSIKVLDFGLSKLANAESNVDLSTSPTMAQHTTPGTMLGTLGYMSPEQVRGQNADARSDIFTFGAILCEMLSGRRAFAGTSAIERASAILRDKPDLSSLAARPVLATLAARCLEKDPADRFQSAEELVTAMETLLAKGGGRATAEPPSVAVMPFADLSPQKDQQYFCEGMADEIITALGGLKGLRVASRTSAVRCQEKGLDAAEIGARLNVKHIVEGTVRQAGKKLRITAQLTSAADSYQLWAERYDRDLDDVFAVQDEIAKAIAERLKVSLAGGRDETLVRKGTDNPEAYALYLQGRYHWARRSRWQLSSALESFEKAIARDPGYAHAYAGLSDCYMLMGAYGVRPGTEIEPKAFAAAERALQLDPQLAEAHHAYGAAQVFCRLDPAGAAHTLGRAIEINPRAAISYDYLAITHAVLGRFGEAVQAASRAVELEPDSVVVKYVAGGSGLWARDLDFAEKMEMRALELEPDAAFAYWVLALVKSVRGHHNEAVAFAERCCMIGDRQPLLLSGLGQTLGRAGDNVRAAAVLDELLGLQTRQYVAPLYIGDVLTGLGRFDEACDYYERSFEERNGFLIRMATSPEFDPIRDHPRFQALLRRMNLPNG